VRRTTRAERERTRERERERTRTHTDQGIERSFIVPGVGEAKSRMSDLSWWPGTSFWTMSDLTSLSHGSHWRMPSIALPILLPTRLCPQLALPTVARSGAPHLTWGNHFYPLAPWTNPTCPKMSTAHVIHYALMVLLSKRVERGRRQPNPTHLITYPYKEGAVLNIHYVNNYCKSLRAVCVSISANSLIKPSQYFIYLLFDTHYELKGCCCDLALFPILLLF